MSKDAPGGKKKGKSSSFMTVSMIYRESLNNLMTMLYQVWHDAKKTTWHNAEIADAPALHPLHHSERAEGVGYVAHSAHFENRCGENAPVHAEFLEKQ